MLFFIGAMREEIEGIAAGLECPVHSEHAGHVVYTGKLSGRDIGVTDAGIGKVNAAMCTQMIIDRFKPEAIINTGIAGSLDPRRSIGDIVLSTDAVSAHTRVSPSMPLLGVRLAKRKSELMTRSSSWETALRLAGTA